MGGGLGVTMGGGLGVTVGAGGWLDGGVQPGGSPVGGPVTLGQAGFAARARCAALTITGGQLTRIESPARWAADPCDADWGPACLTVASICSAAPGSVP